MSDRPETRMEIGKSCALWRPVESRALAACRRLIVNRLDAVVFWVFQDILTLVFTRRIASYRAWGVRASVWATIAATEYWLQHAGKWQPFLDTCDQFDVRPCIYFERGILSFEWYGPRRPTMFARDTDPPMAFLRAHFDALVERLEACECRPYRA